MRRTKIICTIGPASDSKERIKELALAGMNVARLNFSHGEHEYHRKVANRVREVSQEMGVPIAILQDLQGPKIRSGKMENGGVPLKDGDTVVITTEEMLGTSQKFSTTYGNLPNDLVAGNTVLLDDGKIRFTVRGVEGNEIECTVERGGILRDRKGMNLPGVAISEPSLTEKDLIDLRFGIELGVDAVALSFVRSARDIRLLRRELVSASVRPVIIAKLEKPEVLEQFEGILDEADGIMVARGDLGVEIPAERVPMLQKEWVQRANQRGKVTIVATQMLESMIVNENPTRAEASDVANAVLDGADLVMLSGETATGEFPIRAASMMASIITDTEQSSRYPYERIGQRLDLFSAQAHQNALALAAVRAAKDLSAKAIVVYTTSGATAQLVAQYRPSVPIVAFVPSTGQQNSLSFSWGVLGRIAPEETQMEDLLERIDEELQKAALVEKGETIVLLTKVPLASGQRTNTMLLHVVGRLKPVTLVPHH